MLQAKSLDLTAFSNLLIGSAAAFEDMGDCGVDFRLGIEGK